MVSVEVHRKMTYSWIPTHIGRATTIVCKITSVAHNVGVLFWLKSTVIYLSTCTNLVHPKIQLIRIVEDNNSSTDKSPKRCFPTRPTLPQLSGPGNRPSRTTILARGARRDGRLPTTFPLQSITLSQERRCRVEPSRPFDEPPGPARSPTLTTATTADWSLAGNTVCWGRRGHHLEPQGFMSKILQVSLCCPEAAINFSNCYWEMNILRREANHFYLVTLEFKLLGG